ncbi:TatD family hydrolase [Flavobacterium gilvum]|uniref:Hydrolase TatD n=1 Tax=Flavobacterium gilvum TaxID=1492737 RepID=A0AAC9N496_9FLAO|nr:TatD family hydrolase [Flavobacterium gilvum]AOW10345.1 hydrolase TatD [Flavobacterium gilvum]KFC59760.1 TatD family hydrolase [Flavobacterium gilvum]
MEYFNLHTHKFTNQETVLELVNQYPREFDVSIPHYSIGIHPWRIAENSLEEELQIINDKILEINCLSIGECGFDKRIEIPFTLQEIVFERQLLLAQKHNKPVVIHCVAAFQEVIAIKKKLKITVPMIIHGFSKNKQMAKGLIDNGFYLSFGKYLLQNPELKTVFESIPNDRFFLETDTAEVGIEEVYALAAQYKNWSLDELKQQIKSNFATVFKNRL